jgi:hypothetical protein
MSFIQTLLSLFQSAPSKLEEAEEQYQKGKYQALLNDLGEFTYDNSGFLYKGKQYKWNDIEELNAYKADMFTYDEIRIDIVFKGVFLTITEETPGWYQFVIKTKEVFPSIAKDWDDKIVFPPFADNFITLYKKDV